MKYRYLVMLMLFSSQACGNPGSEPSKHELVSSPTIAVTATSGLVSIKAWQAPLGAFLTDFGQRTHITFTVPEELKAEPLTLSLRQRPIEEVLQQMLMGKSYEVRYRQEGGNRVIAEVNLSASAGPTASRASAGAQSPDASKITQSAARLEASGDAKPQMARTDPERMELEQSLRESQDPTTRMAALSSIANRGTDESVTPAVAMALSDRDSGVREAALSILRNSLDPVPVPALASMATQDANPAFRIEAMTLMVDQLAKDEPTQADMETVRATLNQGLGDPDPRVREIATMLLADN